jgi:endonuclease/exonuclease/phosphatase family metal-dependent hydrolase
VNDHYSFHLVLLHLKSRRTIPEADQALMRLEEARFARQHVAKILQADPAANVLLMGDFNDEPDTAPIQLLIGAPPFQLHDLQPVDSEGATWTHYWAHAKQYSRIDYLLTSPAMYAEYVPGTARIADIPEWNHGSDHRAIYARFRAQNQPPPATPAVTPPTHEAALPDRSGPPRWWWIVAGTALVLVLVFVTGRRGAGGR